MLIELNPKFFPENDTVILVAIDPGQTTGVAMGMLGRRGPTLWEAKFCTRTYAWPQDAKDLRDIELTLADVVVVEQWVYIPGKPHLKDWQSAIEVKGFIRGELEIMGGLNKLRFQTPSQKEYASAEETKRAFGDVGKTHEHDASRHLMFYLRSGKNGK